MSIVTRSAIDSYTKMPFPRHSIHFLITLIVATGVSLGQSTRDWKIQKIDTTGKREAHLFTSIASDQAGNLHVVYSDKTGFVLRYAFRAKQAKEWNSTVVDASGGTYEAIAVDSHGRVHIAYNSPSLTGLHYALWDGTRWQKSIIDSARASHQVSIQIDAHDHPAISYFCEEYPDRRYAQFLKYARFDGNAWYIQTVDHRYGTGKWNSVALEVSGSSYIAYAIAESGDIGIAHMEGVKWTRTTVESQEGKGKRYANSAALSPDGKLLVAYLDASDRTLKYSWREGTSWHTEIVDSLVEAGGDGESISMKVEKDGSPCLTYYDSGSGVLKYAYRDQKAWHVETVEMENAGAYATLYLDEDQQPYIVYCGPGGYEIRVAYHSANAKVAAK